MPAYRPTPTKTEEKKPDEFISAIDHLVRWMSAHRLPIVALLATGVIGAAVFLGIKYYQEKRLSQFSRRYYALSQTDFPQAELEQLVADYRGQKVAGLAQTKLIWKAIQAGEWTQAIELITKHLPDLPPFIQPFWKFNLAKIYWITNQTDRAMETLDELDEESYLGEQISWVRAQILESQGKIEEALVLYQEIGQGGDDSIKKLAQLKRIFLGAIQETSGASE